MTLTYDQLQEYLDLFIVEAHADLRWLKDVDYGYIEGAPGNDADENYFKQRIQALKDIKEIVSMYEDLAR